MNPVATCAIGLKVFKARDVVNAIALAWLVCFVIVFLFLELARGRRSVLVRRRSRVQVHANHRVYAVQWPSDMTFLSILSHI